MRSGNQFVMSTGDKLMPMWLADNLDTLNSVSRRIAMFVFQTLLHAKICWLAHCDTIESARLLSLQVKLKFYNVQPRIL